VRADRAGRQRRAPGGRHLSGRFVIGPRRSVIVVGELDIEPHHQRYSFVLCRRSGVALRQTEGLEMTL
jgi:hypothetical protein